MYFIHCIGWHGMSYTSHVMCIAISATCLMHSHSMYIELYFIVFFSEWEACEGFFSPSLVSSTTLASREI
jgi:hypothetical protein